MSEILDKINSPEDVKALSPEDCDKLAGELREFIINTVAQTGGHLASNLGVIELTLALLRVFNFPYDRVVWDVGHQSYAYKILTGRKEAFANLRKWHGLSGFPKREESIYDAFNTGHSSTSISAALGLLRGYRLKGEDRKVIAVIGDGAMTGGMAYEALNDAGVSDENLIVILNDNQMSISYNVGAFAAHLNKLRTSKSYRNFKDRMEDFCLKIPVIGEGLAKVLKKIKGFFRNLFLHKVNAIPEDLGFIYYGPFDGHNRALVEQALHAAADADGPVLIHLLTSKGHGYVPAENSPESYHGVAPFEVETGLPEVLEPDYPTDCTARFEDTLDRCKNFTECFGTSLQYYAMRNEKLVGICAAMAAGTGMESFGKLYPERFYDVGIAEQHAMTLACGMSAAGIKPVVALYSTFLQRALDQVQHDAVLQKLPVVVCLDRAGVVGEDGETHQGLYDLAYLRALPGGEVWAPADYKDLYEMMGEALGREEGPIFIRYPKGAPLFTYEDRRRIRAFCRGDHEEGKKASQGRRIRAGKDLNIVGWGYTTSLAYKAAEKLAEEGIEAGVYDLRRIIPADTELLLEAAREPLLIIEEALPEGSVAEFLEAELYKKNMHVPLRAIHIKNEPVTQGKRQVVLDYYGISVENACAEAKKLLEQTEG